MWSHVKSSNGGLEFPWRSFTSLGPICPTAAARLFFLPGCYVEETSQQYLRGSAGERWDMSHESPDGSVQEWSIQYQWIWGVPPFWTCLKKLPLGSLGESVKPFKSLCFCLWRNDRLRGTWNDLKRCANFSTLIFGNCEDYEWKTVTKHSHPRNMPFWSVLHTFSNGSHIPSSVQMYKNASWLGTSTVHHLSNLIDV